MYKSFVDRHPTRLRSAGRRLGQAAALALLLALAIPARAADERAVKSRIAPTYPEIAKRLRIAGEVRLTVTVNPAGKVTDVKPLSGNSMLAAAATDAVRGWKFEPGDSISTVEVSLTFSLGQ